MKTSHLIALPLIALVLAGCASESNSMESESQPTSQPTETSMAQETTMEDHDEMSTTITLTPSLFVSSGTFSGASGHSTSGSVRVLDTGGKITVQLGEDFSLDGAPAPFVAFGKDGYKPETNMGELKANKGSSTYDVPKGIDATNYNEVIIWCEDFSVPIGVAKLKPFTVE